jgi:hypothetical protein
MAFSSMQPKRSLEEFINTIPLKADMLSVSIDVRFVPITEVRSLARPVG